MSNHALQGNVLITGGAGYLGRAIIRRAERDAWDCRFTVYSRDETKQWELHHRYPGVRVVLGDVESFETLASLMVGHDTVIHAAALKYIPEAEFNVLEAIRVNVIGSQTVALAAAAAGVRRVCGISTDKACAPANVYGRTKALMENIFSECAARRPSIRYATVRYGNVVGSTGSVVPTFRRQLAEDGVIKLTSDLMTRFWLSADDAIDLITWALEDAGPNGATFIPACPAMSLLDLAEAVWLESGGAGPAPIAFMGERPGEKLTEALYSEQEYPRIETVDNPDNVGFILHPSTTTVGAEKRDMGTPPAYLSNAPRRWMGVGEFRELMRDAEAI